MSPATSDTSVVFQLGCSVAGFVNHRFSSAVWEKAKCCLLDSLGLAQIAHDEATTLAMRDLTTAFAPGAGGSRLWPYGTRASLSEAITANAVAVHAHFHDDSDPHSWCHPGSLISPVAVGVTEAEGATIERALRALIAGYSVLNWLGDHEIVAHALIQRGIRTSPSLGTIGAAAAASVAMGLNGVQTANAMAIAASVTGGTLAPLRAGSDEWRVQNAHAARGGLLAAQLARRGVVGASTALEGPKGLLQALAGMEHLPEGWLKPLRDDAMLDIYAKPWATLGDNMAAVRAAKLMYEDGIDPSSIERIEIRIWRAYAEYPGTQYKGPFDLPVQALASTAFATAAMLVLGDLEYDVSMNRRQDLRLLALVAKTQIIPSDDGTKLDSVLTIFLNDGTTRVRHAADAPRTLLYHDVETATHIFENRMIRCGRPADSGRKVGTTLFSSGADNLPMSDLLDRIVPH
jgi:2-methylcitrate dehydratase PrpD